MRTVIFHDFTFRAKHSLPGRSAGAATPHWHTYDVRFWFREGPDQEDICDQLYGKFCYLRGCDMDACADVLGESTDENLARYFLEAMSKWQCIRVRVTNDGVRGAEVMPDPFP